MLLAAWAKYLILRLNVLLRKKYGGVALHVSTSKRPTRARSAQFALRTILRGRTLRRETLPREPLRSGFRSRSCFRDPGNAGTPVECRGVFRHSGNAESTGLLKPEPILKWRRMNSYEKRVGG